MVWQEAIDGLAAWFDLSHTNPEIRDCICSTLCLRSIEACFAPFASPTITAAALDQDANRWMNFIEGRISLEWRMAQSHFYASIGSSRTSRQWAAELVQNLLTMVHKMWIARNDVAHTIDEKGHKIKDGLAMDADIDEQFVLGFEDLMCRDLINIGRPAIDRRSAGEQWAWLHSIQQAHKIGLKEFALETMQMRNSLMDWLHALGNYTQH